MAYELNNTPGYSLDDGILWPVTTVTATEKCMDLYSQGG